MKINSIALTGGMGSGKSTVGTILESLGWKIVDADKIVSNLYFSSHNNYLKITNEIDSWLGSSFRNETSIDKSTLRQILEKTPNGFQDIAKLMTPYIKLEIFNYVEINPWCIIEAPLLIESGLVENFYSTIVVDCSKSTQMERIKKRNPNLNEITINKMIASQTSRRNRLWHANYIIQNENDLSLDALKSQVEEISIACKKAIDVLKN